MASSSNGSSESLPLSSSFRPVLSYGSVFSYYNFLRSGSIQSTHQTLNRSESMVSISHKTLTTYIAEDDVQGLQAYLENKKVAVDDKDENGATALHFAATKGKPNFVRILINHNADINAEDQDNWTPLLCASKEGHFEVVQELLDRDANKEHRDVGGWSALMWASYKGHTNTALLLLEKGADVNAHGNYHISSLLWAAGRGHDVIAKALISHGAKVNVGDKYGTTALVWASRKGNADIVSALLKAGANVDTAGMHSWTPLLVATMGNHVDVVNLLLEHKPNVNAVDKDGCTALILACKEGYTEIAAALIAAGAYINVQDRSGDTNLIHAVKGGHRNIIDLLLKKYADVDIPGKEKKTATYTAVEKGNIPVLKMLLTANPDLEICTKDGDTPLLRAVRSRNADAVSLLMDRKAKVSASDKWGDTALHIAMRARSKAIVEILLRNPKNSQLLYRPNRAGETPYNIDMNHTKTILGQIFGARKLNTNEDNENLLGYDLYSSALADVLSDPSLSMPITVGLFAKWGSGKSFLLNKLREEMKSFARQWYDPIIRFSWVLQIMLCHVSLMVGLIVGLLTWSWFIGVLVTVLLIVACYALYTLLWVSSQRYSWEFPYKFSGILAKKMTTFKIVLQVMFCHPPGTPFADSVTAQPIRFYFSESNRIGTTTAGENSVVQMLGSLYDAIENDYGTFATRLYRAFHPKPLKNATTWRWRRLCCIPNILVFEICFFCSLIIVGIMVIYFSELSLTEDNTSISRITVHVVLGLCGGILLVAVIANLYTISKVLKSLMFSQRRKLQYAIANLETVKSEGFLQVLRKEVALMTDMVKCLDAFSEQQTRLVIIVDGLDSCDQDKVVLILDAVHTLFSNVNSPFITVLAIDPHVIAKVAWEQCIEANSRKHLINETNIGGHDYLHNMVQLPFYLQNSGLRKVKIAQKAAVGKKASMTAGFEGSTTDLGLPSDSGRRSSRGMMDEKLKIPGKRSSRKLKLSESIASSLGSNLNRLGGPHELTKMLLTDDYFSDVNPRTMKRLMNVVYITGRLLKAFQIDFNWYHLASWINITEQWPYRTSWMIFYHESTEDAIEDNMSLKALYDKVRAQIPSSKEMDPLVEFDRDEKKLDVFLSYHRSSLLVGDLRVFLPFTINLDPYLKKVIKDAQQEMEEGANFTVPQSSNVPSWDIWSNRNSNMRKQIFHRSGRQDSLNMPTPPSNATYVSVPSLSTQQWGSPPPAPWPTQMYLPPTRDISSNNQQQMLPLPPEVADVQLNGLTVSGVCQLISNIPDLTPSQISSYLSTIQSNNINGKVLAHCDLNELKKVLNMSFGDWEMFRIVVTRLREKELLNPQPISSSNSGKRSSREGLRERSSTTSQSSHSMSGSRPEGRDKNATKPQSSTMEKQVTLEEQTICGALQTLSEEACEDVLEEKKDLHQDNSGDLMGFSLINRTISQSSFYSSAPDETDVVILQNIPLQSWSAVPCDNVSSCSSGTNTPRSSRIAVHPV
uniref:Kinase D-interacting substrate n=1 Tax=Lygus hesperus TaxID=30085 RepID=A0A146L198_LYGHE